MCIRDSSQPMANRSLARVGPLLVPVNALHFAPVRCPFSRVSHLLWNPHYRSPRRNVKTCSEPPNRYGTPCLKRRQLKPQLLYQPGSLSCPLPDPRHQAITHPVYILRVARQFGLQRAIFQNRAKDEQERAQDADRQGPPGCQHDGHCLLYTSDAADE